MRRTYYLVSLLLQKGVYPENLPLFCHASSKSASFFFLFFLFNLFMCFDLLHRFVCAFILRRKMRGIIFMTTPFLRQSKGWTAKSSQWLEPDGKPLAFLLLLFFQTSSSSRISSLAQCWKSHDLSLLLFLQLRCMWLYASWSFLTSLTLCLILYTGESFFWLC